MTGKLDQFREAGTATSIALFATKAEVFVDAALLEELKAFAESRGKINTRLCLHQSPEANDHDMIVLEYPTGRYYRPHMHAGKSETIHVIEGKLLVISFDQTGNVATRQPIEPGLTSISRVEAGVYHTVLPLTERVIYHESKLGPFLGNEDSLPAPWSPDGTDTEEATSYLREMMKNFT
jgi:cupin fold WbuC family metalloprotein